MARFDEFREANERYAASLDLGDLPVPPACGGDIYGREAASQEVSRARVGGCARDPERRRAGLQGRYLLP